jgi:hypothetical protein
MRGLVFVAISVVSIKICGSRDPIIVVKTRSNVNKLRVNCVIIVSVNRKVDSRYIPEVGELLANVLLQNIDSFESIPSSLDVILRVVGKGVAHELMSLTLDLRHVI